MSPASQNGRLGASGTRSRTNAWSRLALLPLLLVLVGCGQGAGQAAASAASGSPQPASRDSYAVQAAPVGGLGTILVNGAGLTLYMFEPDRQGTPTCTGTCAVEWPPVLLPKGVAGPKAGPGIRASLLGTARRPDGRLQVTYAGWPLYRWNADAAPGQTTGQGLYNWNGRWYVMDPQGKVVTGLP